MFSNIQRSTHVFTKQLYLQRRALSIIHKSTTPACVPLVVPNSLARPFRQFSVDLPYLSEDEIKDYSHVPANVHSDELMQTIEGKIKGGFADCFMVCDLRKLSQRHDLWQQCFPRVQPFYAVKCNNDLRALEVLASLGCGFDCASWKEIKIALSLVKPHDIIFANPCKQQSHMKKAREHNVSKLTFDNSDELLKTAEIQPEAECILRLATNDQDATCQLGCKFGANLNEVPSLLSLARSLDLNVTGISFHCGSGNNNPTAFETALNDARTAFEMGAQAGYDFKLLDIGGGFSGCPQEDDIFVEIANRMNFDDIDEDVRIIAEPGRFYAASIQTLVTRVFSKKQQRDDSYAYYINDGVYGSFNNIMYDHARPIPRKFIPRGHDTTDASETFPSTVFGPTCDGLDCIAKNVALPAMERDDWFMFDNMGAYTNVGGSEFNGMPGPKFEYISC